MSIFSRSPSQPSASDLLLDRLLQLESTRLDHATTLQAKRDELEIRRLEIELASLDATTKAKIEMQRAQQELRLQRQERGRRGAQKRWQQNHPPGDVRCPLCLDPSFRGVTVDLIRAHRQHEPGGQGEAPPGTSG